MTSLAILTLYTADATFPHFLVIADMDVGKPPTLLQQDADGEKNHAERKNYY